MSWNGTQEQRGWQVQRPWGGANTGTSLPFLRSAVIFMAVLVSCGCCIKFLYRRWLNKTEVYSLIVLEAKKSETKVSAGHTPSGGSRGRSLLSLSSSPFPALPFQLGLWPAFLDLQRSQPPVSPSSRHGLHSHLSSLPWPHS